MFLPPSSSSCCTGVLNKNRSMVPVISMSTVIVTSARHRLLQYTIGIIIQASTTETCNTVAQNAFIVQVVMTKLQGAWGLYRIPQGSTTSFSFTGTSIPLHFHCTQWHRDSLQSDMMGKALATKRLLEGRKMASPAWVSASDPTIVIISGDSDLAGYWSLKFHNICLWCCGWDWHALQYCRIGFLQSLVTRILNSSDRVSMLSSDLYC